VNDLHDITVTVLHTSVICLCFATYCNMMFGQTLSYAQSCGLHLKSHLYFMLFLPF